MNKMGVFIATDIRIYKVENDFFLATQHYSIIRRYHDFFGKVTLYCRQGDNSRKQTLIKATDIIERVIYFDSLLSTVTNSSMKKLVEGMKSVDLVVGRFHAFSACQCANIAKKIGKPFLAEVMGDAWDGYWNHSLAGKFVAPYIYTRTQNAIREADYAIYVTEKYLQGRYPCNGYSIGASNVVIDELDEEVVEKRKKREIDSRHISILTAANVDVRAKGHEYVIKALPILAQRGVNATYYIAGGGNQEYLKNIAAKNCVEDKVVFLGRLSPEEVFLNMDKVDVYIQPSLQEGLPRSVIEAMSRGCPVIGAKTAGIPELIEEKYVAKRKSAEDLAEKILYFISLPMIDKQKLYRRNFEEAKKYKKDYLNQKRAIFYKKICDEVSLINE